MNRIEPVGRHLHHLAVASLLAIVQPNGNQGQHSKTLGREPDLSAHQLKYQGLALEPDDIEQHHSDELTDPGT